MPLFEEGRGIIEQHFEQESGQETVRSPKRQVSDRVYGSGSLHKRGRVWYIQYYVRGKQHTESSRSRDESVARLLLAERLSENGGHIDGTLIPSGCLKTVVGTASELLVSVDLMRRGFEVYRAMSQHASCDLIALKDGRSIRVEVTTGRLTRDGRPMVSIIRQLGRHDLLAVVSRKSGIVYAPSLSVLMRERNGR